MALDLADMSTPAVTVSVGEDGDTATVTQSVPAHPFAAYKSLSGLFPSLVSDFASSVYALANEPDGALYSKAFADLFTFTRASTKMVTNSAGDLASVAVDTPAFDHDPALKNLLTYSQQLDNAAWHKDGAIAPTVTADYGLAPDGTNTADRVYIPPSLSRIWQSAISPRTNVFSVWLKSNTGADIASVGLYLREVGFGAIYASVSVTVTPAWQRFTISGDCSASTAGVMALIYNATSGGPGWDLLVWGAQLQEGAAATDYIPTTDAAACQPLGILIEESRTNTVIQSALSASWTATRSTSTAAAASSPDGTNDAAQVAEDTSTANSHYVGQSKTVTTTDVWTASIFLKADGRTWATIYNGSQNTYFDLANGVVGSVAPNLGTTAAITYVGNGWYRCSISFTPGSTSYNFAVGPAIANGNNLYDGDGVSGIYVWGAQLETGAFATSYIPTTTAAVTRAGDVCYRTLGGEYNAAAGSFAVQYQPMELGSNYVLDLNDGTYQNSIYTMSTSSHGLVVYDGGALQANISFELPSLSSVNKVALGFAGNDLAVVQNANVLHADNSATIPAVSKMDVGASYTDSPSLSGHIKSLVYYPSRLPDADLEALAA